MRALGLSLLAGVLFSSLTAMGGAAVTYHGRILDANGSAVNSGSVTFKIQVRSPGVPNCLLYEETRSVPMSDTDGVFVIPIGDGSAARTGSDPGITIENVFSNNPALNLTGLSCNSGGGYQPAALDSRKLFVTFNDGSGSGDQVLPSMDVTYVPFALHSQEAASALKLGTVSASQVLSVASGSAVPMSAANFSELMLLVNGTSNAYVKPASVPSCASGQVLKGTGGAFVCVTDASGSDTLAGISCADGKILKRMAGSWACADESGVGTESDPTVQPFAKKTVGMGLVVDGSDHIGVDFGTAAGKAAQGNDSRFSDSRAPNGSATGDLNGSYPNPTVKGIRGNSVATTTPLNGQIYQWISGSTEWQPKYVSFADLKKSDGTAQMPATCAANETLSWSAITDVFTCAAIGSLDASKITAGTLSASRLPADTIVLTCADGKIAKRVAGTWACADESGVGSETDPSVAAYAKRAPGSGLFVNGSSDLTVDFGTGAGKVVQGNDSRLSDARVASDINGLAATGIVQRTGAGSFTALGVAAPINISGGNVGLAVGAGLTLSSGSLVPAFGTAGGEVAQGNDARFPSGTCAGGNKMRWDGSAWQCETDLATDSTKVLKGGDTMTGALGLPSNGLVVGTSQLVVSGGNVGIGTASPSSLLHVNGTLRAQQICDTSGANCKTISAGWSGSSTVLPCRGGAANLNYNGRCYSLFRFPTPTLTSPMSGVQINTWSNAAANCRAWGGQLAEIKDASTNDIVTNELLVGYSSTTSGWIGGADFNAEGQFYWMSTRTPFSYTNWQSGEPSNYDSSYGVAENCVAITAYGANNGKWNDGACDVGVVSPAFYICESDGSAASSSVEFSGGAYRVAGGTYKTSCLAYLTAYPDLAGLDSSYWIDPDGAGAIAPFKAYCDMTTDGGGYTYYPISSGGISTSRFDANNSCKALGMDIFIPRTKAQLSIVVTKYGTSYFNTIPGVYSTNTTSAAACTTAPMRSTADYGTGCTSAGWRSLDGGKFWLRDTNYSEPNGNYTAGCWLGTASGAGLNNVNAITFDDLNCSNSTSKYICSTNDKP